jgi:hypothetical protein
MKFSVRFSEIEDFGRALGKLRDVLKTNARLVGLQVRKRRFHSALVSGPDSVVYPALLLLMCLGYDCAIVAESEPPNAEIEEPGRTFERGPGTV